jgi:hypothetical protein
MKVKILCSFVDTTSQLERQLAKFLMGGWVIHSVTGLGGEKSYNQRIAYTLIKEDDK